VRDLFALRLVLRVPIPADSRGVFLAGSFLAHLALVLSVSLLPAAGRRPTLPGQALVVELSGPIATRARTSPTPPVPKAPAASPRAAAAELEPATGKKLRPSEPKEKKENKEKKEGKAEASSAPAPPPEASGPGPDSSAPGVQSLALGGLELGWYGSAVTAALASRWLRPVLEGTTEELVAVVAFDIRRDGTVANVRVVQSSGVPSLDRSALRAVLDASPLPPVPPAWSEPFLPAEFRFVWRPEPS